jgi:hypothetical protein
MTNVVGNQRLRSLTMTSPSECGGQNRAIEDVGQCCMPLDPIIQNDVLCLHDRIETCNIRRLQSMFIWTFA